MLAEVSRPPNYLRQLDNHVDFLLGPGAVAAGTQSADPHRDHIVYAVKVAARKGVPGIKRPSPLPPPWSIAIIRQALAADTPRAFRRRCWCAIAAPVQQTVSPLLAHTNSQGRPRTV